MSYITFLIHDSMRLNADLTDVQVMEPRQFIIIIHYRLDSNHAGEFQNFSNIFLSFIKCTFFKLVGTIGFN